MRAGDTASYSGVHTHKYDHVSLTFECQDSRFIENDAGRPVRQWLFHVVADTDDETLAGFLFVSIVDKSEILDEEEFVLSQYEDWDTAEEVLMKAGPKLHTTRGAGFRDEPIPPAEATCSDVVLRTMDSVAQYTTESATLTGALFHALDKIHYIMPSLEPSDEVLA
jgi:hypothetical protein